MKEEEKIESKKVIPLVIVLTLIIVIALTGNIKLLELLSYDYTAWSTDATCFSLYRDVSNYM